jgi:hypothetical protein
LSWKDHEYSTSALSAGSVGWDWFSLQLDDGSALMLFQIRREDGSLEPASSGTFILPDGSTQPLSLEDWELEVLDTWTSPYQRCGIPRGVASIAAGLRNNAGGRAADGQPGTECLNDLLGGSGWF